MIETLEKENVQCPFTDLARHCPHQETYTRDVGSAIKGDMVFICTLEEGDDCPYLRECMEE